MFEGYLTIIHCSTDSNTAQSYTEVSFPARNI